MRFGASCCPTWDPSNWLSRKIPTIMSFWIKSRPRNESEKLLRTASEEEIFKKKPKRKVKKRRKSADDLVVVNEGQQLKSKQTADFALGVSTTAAAIAEKNIVVKSEEKNGENDCSESSNSFSEGGVKPRKRRSGIRTLLFFSHTKLFLNLHYFFN